MLASRRWEVEDVREDPMPYEQQLASKYSITKYSSMSTGDRFVSMMNLRAVFIRLSVLVPVPVQSTVR
jgi:hypothetical protein